MFLILGTYAFTNFINKKEISMDKIHFISHLNNKIVTTDIYLCITKPLGFGKSVTADMIAAYYSYTESRITVFDDKKLSKPENWRKSI